MESGARIVIVGCGFGGLAAARGLSGRGLSITVVDRTNHHVFQPLLYQVATAGLAAPAIAAPIRRTSAAGSCSPTSTRSAPRTRPRAATG